MKEEMRLSQTSSMVSELAPLVLFLRSGRQTRRYAYH